MNKGSKKYGDFKEPIANIRPPVTHIIIAITNLERKFIISSSGMKSRLMALR